MIDIMKIKHIVSIFLCCALLSACTKSDGIAGKWLLVDFCFDDDCTHLADYSIEQIWNLDNKVGYTHQLPNGKTQLRYEGSQFQEGTMDTPIRWWLSPSKDTLFTIDTTGLFMDTMIVQSLTKDTLVLIKQDNHKNVVQLFERQ